MKLNKTLFRIENLILISLLVLGFFVRLYRFDNPIADWHSWRQSDTSAVSRNFALNGFDILHPKFEDLSNVPSGFDNPNGYRFVEFPIYNIFQAGLYKIVPAFSLEESGRLINIFASLFSGVFLFFILRKRFGHEIALFSIFFFLFLPFNIYYSRVILPDPLMVTAILGGIYFFNKWLEKDKLSIFSLYFLLCFIFTSASLLLKPYALFFTMPIIYLAYEKFSFAFFKKWQLWAFLIISLVPLTLWRIWILQYPQGVPVSAWLLNGNGIRFKPSFFYWIFYERLTKLLLGFFGVPIFLIAFFKKFNKNNLSYIGSFILSSIIYISVIATGNVQHDYYQILIIPTVSIILGIGASLFISNKKINKFISMSLLIILVIFSFAISGSLIKDFFNINNHSIVDAGIAVDKLTPKNALVIANYNGDTSFLYQTKRRGWASFEKPLPQMIEMGADYLVIANPTKEDLNLGKTYKILSKTKEYAIFGLKQKP